MTECKLENINCLNEVPIFHLSKYVLLLINDVYSALTIKLLYEILERLNLASLSCFLKGHFNFFTFSDRKEYYACKSAAFMMTGGGNN